MTGTLLQKGGNLSLTKAVPGAHRIRVALGWAPRRIPGLDVDASAFLLGPEGKVRRDEDLVFYNNPKSAEGTVEALGAGGEDAQVFALDLAAMPATVQRIAFTVTIHEGQAKQQHFGRLQAAWARVIEAASGAEIARFELPLAGSTETALTFCEVYRHGAEWKFRAVGQGYAGGLAPLARQYGVDVAEAPEPATAPPPPPVVQPAPPPPSPPTASQHAVRLEKRLVNLAKKDPGLVSLVKKTGVQLEKHGLQEHQAKVALCLDISGSMHGLYRKGSIDTLVRRVLALGFRFDDDGEIDVFLFGSGAYHAGTVTASNYQTFVADMLKRHALEGGTVYGKVIAMIRRHYQVQPSFGRIPVYVMFVTDGDTSDQAESERQMAEASREPLFWQFMAIGTPPTEKKGFFSRLLSSDFKFLQHLDTMHNRFIDNAGFFLVRDPAEPSDEELTELMMGEYPSWLKGARAKGLLR